MAMHGEPEEEEEAGWGSTVWKDDDKVRVLHGENVQPWRSFDDCCGPWKFPNGLMNFLRDAGFRSPTPIQAYTWPVLLNNKDVIGVAKTGSGKTLGYLLPGYIKVKRAETTDKNPYDPRYGPAMLVLAPTRELCQQIFQESERFGAPAQIKTACCFGGAPRKDQVWKLEEGPQCVVATPGRLNDFINDRKIQVNQVMYFVLDEADRMLDMGFKPQIEEIRHAFADVTRQTALYTATWPREVREIAKGLTADPTHIQVGSADNATTNNDITQHIVIVDTGKDKIKFLEREVFSALQKSNGAALIFLNTKKECNQLYKSLREHGAPIACLHGDMDQWERERALHEFKKGSAKVLVATDVAQRGLDIKNVEIVVNYDAPKNGEDYVHRIGRTGRAGNKGDAWTCLQRGETQIAKEIANIMKKAGQDIPQELIDVINSGGYGGGKGGGKKGSRSWTNQPSDLDGSWGNYKAGGGNDNGGGYGGGGYHNGYS